MSCLLLPYGKLAVVFFHSADYQFVKTQADVPDRVHGLLSPGEGYRLLFKMLGGEITVRFMNDRIPTLYSVAHGLRQVLPFLVQVIS